MEFNCKAISKFEEGLGLAAGPSFLLDLTGVGLVLGVVVTSLKSETGIDSVSSALVLEFNAFSEFEDGSGFVAWFPPSQSW